ncbi:hypothetical protein ANN_06415 [Periplaneta americana]|uniref:Scavenger receptor class B member 1 n=1 Tax=Periplaneta americana TaxID=6978 RepID=A0ABQ8TF77_PERAM|nr:hypothetical protein ANN_06415 [Periplaneta americana]
MQCIVFYFRETWEKVNLTINDNHTITFNQRKVFEFDPDLSNGDIDDMVVVPNIPMLSATSQSKHAARFLRLAMASIMDILKIKPFVEVTVGQLLWGYEDPLLKLAKDVVPKEQKLPYEEFGLMYGKNGTAADIVTVFTGGHDITQFGLIDKFNGHTHLPHWKTDACNRLNGSDGSIFPPHITPDTTLYVYEKDLCRLLPLRFLREVETAGGVQGYRFTPPKDVFADVERNPDNDCFCPAGPPCSPNGLFNISLCQFDSPIMLSFPHFYLADPKLREAVEGISEPDPEKHMLYIDVQPVRVKVRSIESIPLRVLVLDKSVPFQQMGVALGARARIQLNLAVSQVVDIKQVATFPDIVFPIMWFEDGIDKLPEEVTDLLSLATNAPPIARAVISYALFAIGVILLIIAVSCLVRSSGRQETLNLEGTSHYVKPEKKPTSTASHIDATNGHTNGKGKTIETLNPAFVGGPENGVTNP